VTGNRWRQADLALPILRASQNPVWTKPPGGRRFAIDRRIVQPILPQPLLNELSRYERVRLFFVLIADGLDFIGQGSGHEACESIATLSLKNKSPSVQEEYGRFLRN
jgi:hypothetical protein